ncbi:hypothetical protein EPO05_06135 [Patescibacteria group bacterium]|nr:MAG: hypothetical protein EPO05_06135 [Patescibacteria group bacterium]
MATFADMQNDVRILVMGNLDSDTIKLLLNRAQSQICENYDWSFLLTNTVINSVVPKQHGTITVSQGSPLVIGAGTAFGQDDVGSFIWIGGINTAPYPIQSVQGTAVLTMVAPWCGPSMVATGYSMSPLYYLVENALQILAIRQTVWLDKVTRETLNALDPARIAQGGDPALKWAMGPPSPDSSQTCELWPVPQTPLPYLVDFKRRPLAMVSPFDIPLAPYSCIEAKAMMAACDSLFASTGQQSWAVLGAKYAAQYQQELDDCRAADRKNWMHADGLTAPSATSILSDALYMSNHDPLGPPN